MNQEQRKALVKFGSAVRELMDCGVIRSHRYLGDIAEFLCANEYGIDLENNLREVGHDGVLNNSRVQIKYGGGKKKNVDLGNPEAYDEVFIVLGKESVLRTQPNNADFLVYRMTADEVRALGTTNAGKYSCGSIQFAGPPDRAISLLNEDDA
jgi:hypothetical protein